MSRLNFAREEMEKAFPGANFDPDAEILKAILLPDANDLHVVAVAVAAHANSIVTYNVRRSPIGFSVRLGFVRKLRTGSAPVFSARLRLRSSRAPLHRASLKRQSYNPESYLDHLGSLELDRNADLLRTCQATF